ncbi:hypothetical protein GOODEAATRI_009666 [Goodea atripinnis]|uniref:Uncharacterized protein n=1 Tax=Goodea atripinnis TaxID=208336 RepID=A0ABV0P561_9TELE
MQRERTESSAAFSVSFSCLPEYGGSLGQTCQAKLDRWSSHSYQEPEVAPVEAHMFDLDCLLSDISDTLFTMTQKPCPWTSNLHNNIFLNYRGQPTDHSGYVDCSYFEAPPSTIYAPVPSPVETAPQLLIDTQLAQVVLLIKFSPAKLLWSVLLKTDIIVDLVDKLNLSSLQPSRSSDSLPQPSTSSPRSEQTRVSQDCGEYHTSSLGSEAMPYGHQSYHDASVSSAYTGNTAQPVSASIPFMHPLPCHKFGFYTTSATSTVITHTASTMGAQGSVYQAHTYAPAVDPYSQTHCHSLSYPAATSDPIHAALAPVTATHCLSIPEQVAVSAVRAKHKQKTGGLRTVGSPALPSNPQSTAPVPTSCLAKLLSSSTHEMVLSSLRLLSTTTAILTDPSLLPEQAAFAPSALTGGAVRCSEGGEAQIGVFVLGAARSAVHFSTTIQEEGPKLRLTISTSAHPSPGYPNILRIRTDTCQNTDLNRTKERRHGKS